MRINMEVQVSMYLIKCSGCLNKENLDIFLTTFISISFFHFFQKRTINVHRGLFYLLNISFSVSCTMCNGYCIIAIDSHLCLSPLGGSTLMFS